MKTIWETQEWIAESDKIIGKIFRSAKNLPEADRDDIKQDILLRIWKLREKYDHRFPLKPWLKIVSRNAYLSCLKKRYGLPKNEIKREIKKNFKYPLSLAQERTVCCDAVRSDYFIDMDIVDPVTSKRFDLPNIDTFNSIINQEEKRILCLRLENKSVSYISKKCRVSRPTIYKKLRQIKRKYRELI